MRLLAVGFGHWRDGRYDDADRLARELAAREPSWAKPHALLSAVRLALGEVDEAVRWSREALARDPGDSHARASYGMCLLAGGDPTGWRWCLHPDLQQAVPSTLCSSPRWDGSPLGNRTISVHSHGDGGLGDVILHARFLRYLRERGARRVSAVLEPYHARLAPLLTAQGYLDAVSVGEEPEPAADVHTRFSNLAPLLSVTGPVPIAEPAYLVAPPHPLGEQVRGLPGLRVGLVWGSRTPPDQQERYGRWSGRNLPLGALAPLWRVPDVSWVSLQMGPHAAALAAAPPAGARVHDLADQQDDMAVTAAAIAACDLVITVDTAVANLSGALGGPTWVLLHDSHDLRWFGPTPGATYRYPGTALFRQAPCTGWGPVVAAVERALRRVTGAAPGPERERHLRHPSGAGVVDRG